MVCYRYFRRLLLRCVAYAALSSNTNKNISVSLILCKRLVMSNERTPTFSVSTWVQLCSGLLSLPCQQHSINGLHYCSWSGMFRLTQLPETVIASCYR